MESNAYQSDGDDSALDDSAMKLKSQMSQEEFREGAVVWAKFRDYPWWPAMIEKDPDFNTYFWSGDKNNPSQYHVVFMDEAVSRAWVSKNHIQRLLPSQTVSSMGPFVNKKTKKRYSHKVKEAFNNALLALKMNTPMRLQKYAFLERFANRDVYETSDEDELFTLHHSSKACKKRRRKFAKKPKNVIHEANSDTNKFDNNWSEKQKEIAVDGKKCGASEVNNDLTSSVEFDWLPKVLCTSMNSETGWDESLEKHSDVSMDDIIGELSSDWSTSIEFELP